MASKASGAAIQPSRFQQSNSASAPPDPGQNPASSSYLTGNSASYILPAASFGLPVDPTQRSTMIGASAPSQPYNPNVFPHYPPPEKHKQDYDNLWSQILGDGPPQGTQAPQQMHQAQNHHQPLPGTSQFARAPAAYKDDVIARTLGIDQFSPNMGYNTTGPMQYPTAPQITSYPPPPHPPSQANFGPISAVPSMMQASGMQAGPDITRSPDSYFSTTSPPGLHQHPAHRVSVPTFSAASASLYGHLPQQSPDEELRFSQILARNSPQATNTFGSAGSPTGHVQYTNEYFPNSAGMMQQFQQQQQSPVHSHHHANSLPNMQMPAIPPPSQMGATEPPPHEAKSQQGRTTKPSGQSGGGARKLAVAVSRRDPNQRLDQPHATQRFVPGLSSSVGGINGATATASTQPVPKTSSHKRQRVQDSDDDSDDDLPGHDNPSRLPGACAPCKKLKMKCFFPPSQEACQRCINSGRGHLCVVGPRKPRQPSNKKEQLIQKLKEKDAVIDSLLKQLHNPHLVTPLVVDPARISPSVTSGREERQLDPHIVEWIEKAQASVKGNGATTIGGYRIYNEEVSSASDSETGENDLIKPKKNSAFGGSSASRRSSDRRRSNELNGQLDPEDSQGVSIPRRPGSAKLHSLPVEQTPIGLLASMSLKETAGQRSRAASAIDAGEIPEGDPEEDDELGPARKDYYQPGAGADLGLRKIIIERRNVPEIMATGLITPTEVEKLFNIFFTRMNLFISILDEEIYTPATTFGRCPFLFTAICATASRYYTERPELYAISMHFAKTSAASALIDGWKSVEVCQAYLLMSVYGVPSRKWEEAREWMYLGLAIRMATDLNLHLPSTTKIISEQHEREILNRTRTWINCYNLDRSTSAQLGKPWTIQDDWIIRNSKDWWRRSKFNHRFDIHMTAYTDMLHTIMTRFQATIYSDPKSPNMLKKDLNFKEVCTRYDDELQTWKAECHVKFATCSDPTSPQCAYRVQLLPFYVNYSRLVILSFAFQAAGQGELKTGDEMVLRCLDAASSVIKVIVDTLAPTDFLRYAPDGHFVFVSFAAAFLLKMLRKQPAPVLDEEQHDRVIGLVQKLIDTLKSPRIAVDERHTPMLYSRFLTTLLAKYKAPQAETDARRSSKSPKSPSAKSTSSLVAPRPRHKHHGSSPSIEIVPPQPESKDAEMHTYEPVEYAGFELVPHPLSHQAVEQRTQHQQQHQHQQQQQQQVNGQQHPGQFGLQPTIDGLGNTFEAISASAATSTVHPASTVHGSQYAGQQAMVVDDHMLAPMYAVQNDAFWQNWMMPGFSWGPGTVPWEVQMADDFAAASGASNSNQTSNNFSQRR